MERMLERAKEELEMLETLHPDRFDYLKLELKSFISLLQSHSQQLFLDPLPTSSDATTQASTSMKRKREYLKKGRKMEEDEEWEREKFEYQNNKKVRLRRDRVDVVLEKAQACLRKIQDFKFSLSF